MSTSKWFVNRQCYWGVEPDEAHVVEIAAGGLDYANPDMLVSKYAGEGDTYTDPREAVSSAITIAEQWKKDCPNLVISIAHGFTGGMTMPFEASEVQELREWAAKAYEALPKCDQCGEPLPEEHWHPTEDPDLGKFCSEYCCDKAIAVSHELNEEVEV